jgi:hypothetical protein
VRAKVMHDHGPKSNIPNGRKARRDGSGGGKWRARSCGWGAGLRLFLWMGGGCGFAGWNERHAGCEIRSRMLQPTCRSFHPRYAYTPPPIHRNTSASTPHPPLPSRHLLSPPLPSRLAFLPGSRLGMRADPDLGSTPTSSRIPSCRKDALSTRSSPGRLSLCPRRTSMDVEIHFPRRRGIRCTWWRSPPGFIPPIGGVLRTTNLSYFAFRACLLGFSRV